MSLIALKCAMYERKSGGAWVNPYVTDGLVSMFDGEWNNGGGVHSDTELSDIVSGYAMTKPTPRLTLLASASYKEPQ